MLFENFVQNYKIYEPNNDAILLAETTNFSPDYCSYSLYITEGDIVAGIEWLNINPEGMRHEQ